MKIMLSAGEVSGDLHGASLAKELKRLDPRVQLIGFGGRRMAENGVSLFRNFADYNVMGVWEVIKNLRRIKQLLDDLTGYMRQEKPDLLVLIDYPDFNWRLAKRARELGIRVFSYIPPSAWAWRKGRAADCAKLAQDFVAIFPHEIGVYQAAGANISFVGNPLVDKVKPSMTVAEAERFFGIEPNTHTVLLMPGSRRQEIAMLLPPMLGAAKLLQEQRPDTRFYLPVADGVNISEIKKRILEFNVEVVLIEGHNYDLMQVADVAIATSGTVIMEAALMGLPCVVLYRMAPLNYFLGKLLVHIDNFSLPNIVMGKRIQPELLQDQVEPGRIAQEALKLYKGAPGRERVMADLREACAKLGPEGAAGRVAEKIMAAAALTATGDGGNL